MASIRIPSNKGARKQINNPTQTTAASNSRGKSMLAQPAMAVVIAPSEAISLGTRERVTAGEYLT